MSIIKVEYNELGSDITQTQTVGVEQFGKWISPHSIDKILVEFLIYRLKGAYIPLNLEILEEPTIKLTIAKPNNITKELYPKIYPGGRELRLLNEWAYASNLMVGIHICTIKFLDGTKFLIHCKNLGELNGRLAFAMQSIRGEWPEWEVKKEAYNVYNVFSPYPSYLDAANRDIKLSTPKIYEILGADNTERMLLERANIRIDKGLDPYPFVEFDDDMDIPLLKTFDLDETQIEGIKNIFNSSFSIGRDKIKITNTHLTYGSLKVLRNAKINSLLDMRHILPSDVLITMGRYLSINRDSDSQYTMTAKPYATILHDRWDVRYEGFSGPFNNRHPMFSSMFMDTDFIFGSVGPFSADHIIMYSDHNASINPPFTSLFFSLTRGAIEEAFDSGECRPEMLIFVKVPNWYEEESIDWMKSEDNKYLTSFRIIPNGKYFFERLNGNNLLRLTGGLLFAVFSPLGKKHPKFTEEEMDKLVEDFRLSTPPEVLNAKMDKRQYIDKYSLVSLVKEGKDVLNMVKSGKAISKMSLKELEEFIDKTKKELESEDQK